MSPSGTKLTSQWSYVVALSSSKCRALLNGPALYVGCRQSCIDEARGANWWWWWWKGELCGSTLQLRERVWAGVCLPPYCQVCLYHHYHKYSCSGVFNLILPSQAPYEDIQEEDCLLNPAGTKCTSQSSYVIAVLSSMCHALLDVPAYYVGYSQPCIDEAPGANWWWWWWWWEGELCARALQLREHVFTATLPGVSLPPYSSKSIFPTLVVLIQEYSESPLLVPRARFTAVMHECPVMPKWY